MPGTAVIGIGNILQADDGVGVRAVELLRSRGRLPGAELMDAGTATLDVLPELLQRSRVLIVDALRGGGEPGTLYRLTPAELGACASAARFAHGVGVPDLLLMAERMGASPEVLVFGVEPAEIGWSLELSPAVEAALPALLDAIEAEIAEDA